MKSLRFRDWAAWLAAGTTGLGMATPSHAETRALLVGVWQFQSPIIPDLKGPENDLGAMETLVRSEGAKDVTVLRNDEASRTTVETALHALGLRAKPGDWILFYYSGHGAEAEAAIKGTRDGDRDQFVPLAKFDPDHQDVERFIVDKDFYAWIQRYIPPDVKVLMVADTCHSGTMNRSVDPAMFHFTPRLAFRGDSAAFKLIPRPAPRFPGVLAGNDGMTTSRDLAGPDRPDLPNVIYVGAAQDDQLALEAAMPVEGAPSRGLLTYSFEQALTARSADGKSLVADLDGDGKVSVSELAIYLDSQVRALTGQRQQPRTSYVSGNEGVALFAQVLPAPTTAPKRPLPGVYVADPSSVALPQGDAQPWTVAASAAQADFVWNPTTGTLLRRSGDTVASGLFRASGLRGAIEKWNAIDALRPYVDESRARLLIGPEANGARYQPGATVTVSLRHAGPAIARSYATIFNLASDGTVQLLYPVAADGDGLLGPDGVLPVIENRVVSPYGADHVVAVVTPGAPQPLRALLRTLDNQPAAAQIVEPVRKLIADPSQHGSISIAEIYSGR